MFVPTICFIKKAFRRKYILILIWAYFCNCLYIPVKSCIKQGFETTGRNCFKKKNSTEKHYKYFS